MSHKQRRSAQCGRPYQEITAIQSEEGETLVHILVYRSKQNRRWKSFEKSRQM